MDSFKLIGDSTFKPMLKWTVRGVEALLKKGTFVEESPAFEWPGYLVGARARLELKSDDWLYLSLVLSGLDPEAVKITPTVFYALRDRSEMTTTPQDVIQPSTYLFKSKFDFSHRFEQFLVHKSCLDRRVDLRFNVDDSVVIEVYLEPMLTSHLSWTNEGNLKFCVARYQERKRAEAGGVVWFQESPYFHTHRYGYRVRAFWYLNGKDHHLGKGLSLGISFLPGLYDKALPSTFAHRTTVTLHHREFPERDITKSVDMDIANGLEYCVHVCDHEAAEVLLEKDVLYYTVSVRPNRKRPLECGEENARKLSNCLTFENNFQLVNLHLNDFDFM